MRNAFGVVAFYLWMRDGQSRYRNAFFTVILAFLLFVTRQNLISLLLECFIVYNLLVRRMSLLVLALSFAGLLFAFSELGNLRTGR